MQRVSGEKGRRAVGLSLVVCGLVVLIAVEAAAQGRYAQVAREFDQPRMLHEALVLPAADNVQAVVVFRIPNSLLVFVQQEGRFTATPEVTVELHRDGRKYDERLWRGTHTAPSFEATQDRLMDVEGAVTFDLPPGSYDYELSLTDGAAGPVRGTRGRTFHVPDFSEESLGRPFLGTVESAEVGRVRLLPANLGGDAPFGQRTDVLLPVVSMSEGVGTVPARFSYRLYRLASNAGARTGAAPDEPTRTEVDVLVAEGVVDPRDAVGLGEVDPACLCWSPVDRAFGRLLRLDLSTEGLEDGTYLLEVERIGDGGVAATKAVFSTLWRDMPLSLYDPEVAIRNLEFIESRDQVRSMLRGSREDRIASFRAYWKERDPTPGTVYNELMAEYYRRVDVAARRFQTGRTPYPDGLRTDAARIFIVHGPPDDVSSTFPSSGGVQQIWSYSDGRRFVFRAASSLDALELIDEPSSSSDG